jgi:hypothetical protein
MKRATDLDTFTLAMLEAALWSSNDESDEGGGEPLDKNYGIEDIATPSLNALAAEAEEFQRDMSDEIGDQEEQAGHDFWLTRNGHGAGFWDGDWPEPAATKLTKESKAYGNIDLYVGDDGKIYASGYEGGGESELGAARRGRMNQPDYTHYVVDPDDLTIMSGWSFKEDAQDAVRDEAEDVGDRFEAPQRKIYTGKYLRSKGADPDDDQNWMGSSSRPYEGEPRERHSWRPGLGAAPSGRYQRPPREGTRVRFAPNPASYRLYSTPPPLGDEGRVTTTLVPTGRGMARRTYMRGPGGGLVYVNWNRVGVMGVALQDIERVR